jgi:hypothetical protein
MEMLSNRRAKANRQTEAISAGLLLEKPMNEIEAASKMNAADSGIRLSYRETNQPENGRPISELIGMHSKIVPNSASL